MSQSHQLFALLLLLSSAVPSHIPTWALDEYWGMGSTTSAAQVRQYVTYAEGGIGNDKARSDLSADTAGILRHANEAWYVHEPGYYDISHRAYGSFTESCNGRTVTIPVYELNAANASVRSYFTSFMHTYAGTWDYFFMDNTHGTVISQMYGPGGGFCHNYPNKYCTSTRELPTAGSIVGEHAALANAITHSNGGVMQGFYNSLDFSGSEPEDLNVLTSSSHFTGVVCESCVVSLGTFRPSMYAAVLNAMAKVNAIANAHFVLLSQGVSPAGSSAQIAQRKITTATAWLGYNQAHTVVWPHLQAGTSLNIFPENSIVPMSPLQTMSSGAANLEVAPGVYRREFANCYKAGVAIGPCMAIINATRSNIVIRSSWLHESYGHVVDLIGGAIPNGGYVSLTAVRFYPNSTYIAPAQGMMITR